MASNFKIGTTLLGIASLDGLTVAVPDPRSTYEPYTKALALGNGTVRGGGWRAATWHWDVISRAQADQLRAFCSGASAVVFIRTRTNASTDQFKIYQAVMIWPLPEMRDFTRRTDFNIRFQAMVEQAEPES